MLQAANAASDAITVTTAFQLNGSDTATVARCRMRPLQTTALEAGTAAASCTLVETTFGSHQQPSGEFLLS